VIPADSGAELRGTGVSLRLPRETAAALPAGAKRAVAGIRPEHLKPAAAAPSGTTPSSTGPSAAAAVEGSVEVIEPLGSEQHVIVKVGDAIVTAKMAREHKIGVGEKIAFTLDPARLHVFDADSGRALR
jgi:multiple sugar transport system ATP-binding protein